MAKDILSTPKSFYKEFFRKPDADKTNTHYCPGCGHGVIHKLLAEAIEDFGIADRTIIISPVGCSVFAYYYFDTGNVQVAHGRAPAVATGLKRANPNSIVISYQGDGDLAAIGGNNILQAANRGENITVIFVNNAIYGMTGGQMAPTTLIGQKTTTTPYGRAAANEGYPIRICELLSALSGPVYLARGAITDPATIMKTRLAIRKAIKAQMDYKGFSLVEILSPCPSGWRMTPVEAKKWVKEQMVKIFPLGTFKDETKEREPIAYEKREYTKEEIKQALGLDKEAPHFSHSMDDVKPIWRNPKIKISGFGGQGVLLLGNTLAEAGMEQGYHVSWIPSYGPEMRGGTANCHVQISTSEIASPVVDHPSILVAMNLPSLDRFEDDVVPGGLIIYNTSLVTRAPKRTDIESIPIPATDIADKLGSLKVANMVVLGAIIEKTGIVTEEAAISALNTVVKHKKFIPMNIEAIKRGREYVRNL